MNEKHIYLSPHHDDVCFSLATTISKNIDSHIFNIFTRSNFTFQKIDSQLNPDQIIENVSKIRDLEDETFAKTLAIGRSNFSLIDASVKGLNPFDLADIQDEINDISSQILPDLFEMLNQSKSDNFIYCPMGVGKHRNHLSTLISILDNFNDLHSRSKVFFYEELPYSSNKYNKGEAVTRLKEAFPNNQLIRHITKLSSGQFEEKMQLISIYKSQHLPTVDSHSFIPYDSLITLPHEAYWEVIIT